MVPFWDLFFLKHLFLPRFLALCAPCSNFTYRHFVSPFCCLLHFLAPHQAVFLLTCLRGPILGPLFNPFRAWGRSLWELFAHERSFFPRSIFHCATSAMLVIRLLFTSGVLDIFVFSIFSLIHKVSFHSPSLETKLTFLRVLYNAADNIHPISRKYPR